MIEKMQLIAKMRGQIFDNVDQTEMKQKKAYALRRGKQMFVGLEEGKTYFKMKKLGKKQSLTSSWESPLFFMKYLDGNELLEQDERGRICVIKWKDKKFWGRPKRDLHIYHVAP